MDVHLNRGRMVGAMRGLALPLGGLTACPHNRLRRAVSALVAAILWLSVAQPRPVLATAPIVVEPGFALTVLASGLSWPTSMTYGPDQRLFVSQRSGEILVLDDTDGDQQVDRVQTFANGFNEPLGLAFRGTDLYVSSRGKVTRLQDLDHNDVADVRQEIITGLPSGQEISWHANNNLVFGPDGKLYFGLGSTCNQCIESDPRSATIMRYNADGTGEEIYATGLRNVYDLAFHPEDGTLWAPENSLNGLSTTLPPDELNLIIKGGDYGWPDCWGSGGGTNCAGTMPPIVELEAHASADGITFYTGNQFPDSFRNNLFIAEYGSPGGVGGHKVVRVQVASTAAGYHATVSDFIVNITSPLDVIVAPDGALLIADHIEGTIYRVIYDGNTRRPLDDGDYAFTYDSIRGVRDPGASGGGCRVTNAIRSFSYTSPPATALTLLSYRGPDQGKVQIWIDGVDRGIVDLYAPTAQYQYPLPYSGLANQPHHIEMRTVGQKNPASTGTQVRVDALDVNGSRIEDSLWNLNSWRRYPDARSFGNAHRYSPMRSASVAFTVTGSSFTWITNMGPHYGVAGIYVDGRHFKWVDLYAPEMVWRHQERVEGLSEGSHLVHIAATGAKNPAATWMHVVHDGVILP
jgi:glucose/arabinose dehydrogenase